MTTANLITALKGPILNRPTDDDLFADPGDFEVALTRAEAFWYRQVATHFPELLKVTSSAIASSDGGTTYLLTDDHYGDLEVYTPPGPSSGELIVKALPESQIFGFYVEGRNLKLTYVKNYTPGIYVRWVPATLTALASGVTNPALPAYFEDAYLYRAAYYLAQKPGFIGDPEFFRMQARAQWDGEQDSMSDSGLLGTLSKQYASQGFESIGGASVPWYKNISTGS
jgi:hypothetical protein